MRTEDRSFSCDVKTCQDCRLPRDYTAAIEPSLPLATALQHCLLTQSVQGSKLLIFLRDLQWLATQLYLFLHELWHTDCWPVDTTTYCTGQSNCIHFDKTSATLFCNRPHVRVKSKLTLVITCNETLDIPKYLFYVKQT